MFLSGFQQFPSIRFVVILSKLAANKTHTYTFTEIFKKSDFVDRFARFFRAYFLSLQNSFALLCSKIVKESLNK